MQKKKKNKLFIFLIICFVLMPFLFTKGCNYMESLNQAENSISEPILSASAYSHIHEIAHNAQVHSIRKANWTGTAVPSSGYVENIYLNTNLSVEDVVPILEDIYDKYSIGGAVTLLRYGNNMSLEIVHTGTAPHTWYIGDIKNFLIYFAENLHAGYSDFIGWNPAINGVIEVDSEVSGNIDLSEYSNLFSITPFEQSSDNELSIGNLFTQLGNAIIIFGGAVVNVFISMEPIFWNNGPTLIFILLIASVSFALVFWGIELLISLIGVFKTKRKKKK